MINRTVSNVDRGSVPNQLSKDRLLTDDLADLFVPKPRLFVQSSKPWGSKYRGKNEENDTALTIPCALYIGDFHCVGAHLRQLS